ncbi:MarR family winged helix-turn-helix transcriptional regulator [Mycolicibacterium mengxianglii]|uniref:MarR family winged helix-turn-helix transcriptional regulator n=1 Tax=Mycolicibacterium mengxianglii TaxID=2736649 RepID=UPI0018D0A951|nr:MarR family winged helix-turn-helix transcriptional regulator [Mycolicibacterium mengxianglii]
MDDSGLDDRARKLAELAQLILSAAREIRARGYEDPDAVSLNPSEANVMRYIDAHPGATPSAVAEATGLRRSNLSAALRVLESRGFVERRIDPDDGRGINLFPTARAARNLLVVQREWANTLAVGLGEDDSDVEAANRLLTRLEAGLVATRRR